MTDGFTFRNIVVYTGTQTADNTNNLPEYKTMETWNLLKTVPVYKCFANNGILT